MSTDKFRFCEDVLFEAGKASEQSEVFCAVTMETPVRFEANRLKEIQGRETSVLTLRLVKQGRIGLASVSGSLDPKEVVRMAVDTSVFGAQARFEMPAHQDYPSIDVYDPGVDKVSPEQLVHLGQGMIDRVRARAPDLVCDGSVTKATVEVFVGNSKGCSVRYKKSIFSAGIEGTLIRGEDMLFVGDAEVSCREITGTSGIEEQTLWQLENARELAKVKTKTMPVIFTPRGVAGTLVGPLSIGFNGKTVFEGTSPLKGKLGQRLFDSKLDLADDPLESFLPESRPCDDEGLPSRRNTLVNQGRVAGFLYDLQTGGMAGVPSTASANRGRGPMPGPGITCLVFGNGDMGFDDMVSNIGEGLVVDHLMGAEQGNVLGGDFSGNVLLGYVVDRGRIAGRAKNVMVSGNVYQALQHIVALSEETKLVYGAVRAPYVWLEGLAVAAKESD